jgi:hypothetical protein
LKNIEGTKFRSAGDADDRVTLEQGDEYESVDHIGMNHLNTAVAYGMISD